MIAKEKEGCRLKWDIGIDIFTLLCIKQTTNENPLYNSKKLLNGVLCGDLNGKEIQKRGICVYI